MDRIKCPVLYLVFDVRQKSQRTTILHEAHFLPCVCTLYTMACRSTQISKLRKQCVVAAAPIIIRKIYINSKNGHIMLVERGWSAKKVFVLIKFCWSCIHVVYWAFISSMGTRPILHWFHTRCTAFSFIDFERVFAFVALLFSEILSSGFSYICRSKLRTCIKIALTPDTEMQRLQLCLLQPKNTFSSRLQTISWTTIFCGILPIASLTTTQRKKNGKFVVMEISQSDGTVWTFVR